MPFAVVAFVVVPFVAVSFVAVAFVAGAFAVGAFVAVADLMKRLELFVEFVAVVAVDLIGNWLESALGCRN